MKKISLVESIKQVMEDQTGDSFILDLGSEFVKRNRFSWSIHLPLEKSMGWIHHAYGKDGKVVIQTPIFFEVKRRIEYDYPDYLQEEQLRRSIGEFHKRDVRMKYAKEVPGIAAFFDELGDAAEEVNSTNSTGIRIVNENGTVLAEVELPEKEAQEGEVLRRNVKAIKEFDLRISRWLREEYDRLVDAEVDSSS